MIELEKTDGSSVFVNPLHVVTIVQGAGHGERRVSLVRLTGDETHHVYGAPGEIAGRLGGRKDTSSVKPLRESPS